MDPRAPLHLFEAFGVEVEYMIVDARTLDVRPITDQVLEAVGGEIDDVELDEVTWSNELVAHVIELKGTQPVVSLAPLPAALQGSVRRINDELRPLGARLMPTGMHPWMDPHREMVLWPHDNSAIYEAFNRIFDCRGHGWANLQSVHLNLPFADDAEFARLHAAVRVLLPILPALAASSPIIDGRPSGWLDTRLNVYRENSRRIPRVSGLVVPEPVFTAAAYASEILEPLYADIAPQDPGGVLQHEWLNARGAIARFERNTIEVRVLDVQECPQADVAICALVADVLESLANGRWGNPADLQAWPVQPLADLFLEVVRDAEQTIVTDGDYLQTLGVPGRQSLDAGSVWRHLADAVGPSARSADPALRPALEVILNQGPLSRRILKCVSAAPSRDRLLLVFRQLCECLAAGRMFTGVE
jgi:gamma-glutamyl:cysteine ligase YbdK (ATP-grasp superfamily)